MANLLYIVVPILFAALVAGLTSLAHRKRVPKRLDLEVDAFSRALTAIQPPEARPPAPPPVRVQVLEPGHKRGASSGQ